MPDINTAVPTALPSTSKLIGSTVLAAAIASVLLVAVVLPAEYGVDPTGIGHALGLTGMGVIKVSLAKEAQRQEAPVTTVTTTPLPIAVATASVAATGRADETRVTLRPGEGKEVKLVMREGARVMYSWSSAGGGVNFDMHADSVSPKRDYYGYAKGTAVPSSQGELVAAFDGSHGWFWRNRTKVDVTVTLKTEGEYTELKELK